MGHLPDYVCTSCGLQTPRANLVAKKVSFGTLGSNSVMLKSRTVAWLCFPCVKKDPAWQLEEYESPGFKQADEVEAMARAARQYRQLAGERLPRSLPTVDQSDNS